MTMMLLSSQGGFKAYVLNSVTFLPPAHCTAGLRKISDSEKTGMCQWSAARDGPKGED